MKRSIVLKNISVSLLLQLITLINGLVIPKIILSNFGSSVNGLIASISQFLNYITLLEGGIGAVVMSALYRPLLNKDTKKISSIVKASDNFFKSIALIFLVYVVILALFGPIFIWKSFDWQYTASLVIILAANAFIQYYFSITNKILLNADQKSYVVSFVQIGALLLNLCFGIIVAIFYPQVHLLKFATALAFGVQPIIFNRYVKKNYKLDLSAESDKNALKNRWDGFGQNVAYVVHMNTDVAVLTILSSLSNVSIYSVYNLVITALKNFVVAISSAMLPSLGSVLVSDDLKKTNDSFGIYELSVGLVATILFSCGSILVTDFVLVYTSNIHDANYNQFLFGILIMAAIAVGCIRDPYINIANAAGHFKQTAKFAYIEATINIVISIILVHTYGLIGVAMGTLVASFYRYVAQLFYLRKHILNRSIFLGMKSFFCYILIFVISNILSLILLKFDIHNYFNWFIKALFTFLIVITVLIVVVFVFYKSYIYRILRRKI